MTEIPLDDIIGEHKGKLGRIPELQIAREKIKKELARKALL